jgi:peptidoglycan/LPS O-acetylase OafA/YrhL
LAESLIAQAAAKRNFHSLDGVRGIAALLVVLFHYHAYVSPLEVQSAYLAVDLFFLMSGFVLGHAYEEKIAAGMTLKRFFLMRFVRLYPLYLIGTLLAIGVPVVGLLLHRSLGWTWEMMVFAAVPALLMLPGPSNGMAGPVFYPFNGPAWSLFFEILVNVLYAALLRLRAPVVEKSLFLLAVPVLIFAAFSFGSLNGWQVPQWWIALVRTVFSFFLGVQMIRFFRSGKLPRVRVPPAFALVAAIVMLVAGPPEAWRALYDIVCVCLVFPVIIWLCVTNEPRAMTRVYSFLGLISYPLYVIHVPALYLVDRAGERLWQSSPARYAPWIGFILLAVLVALSWVLAVTYDIWARRRLAQMLGQRAGKVP